MCFILLYVDKKALCNKKSGWADSNRRPPVPQTDTLTTALHPETTYSHFFDSLCQLDIYINRNLRNPEKCGLLEKE